jgi:hypothetical protein
MAQRPRSRSPGASRRRMASPPGRRRGSSPGSGEPALPRVVRHGLECPERLLFARWEPGKEYTRGLALKNVSGQAITLRHQALSGATFSLAYPEAVKLRPGMTHVLQVRL